MNTVEANTAARKGQTGRNEMNITDKRELIEWAANTDAEALDAAIKALECMARMS